MSTMDVAVRRPQRWDTPFCEQMTAADVDQLLKVAPFARMDAARFSGSCSLRDILLNDTRILRLKYGDIIVREGDYGNSAFVILEGSVRVVLESLPAKLLGRATRVRKNLVATALQQLFGKAIPEVREYGKAQLPEGLGRRGAGETTQVFLQDVPGVLDQTHSLGLSRGEIFGELAAMSRSPRTATVIADGNPPTERPAGHGPTGQAPTGHGQTTVLEIRWQGLRDLMRNDPALKTQIDELYRANSLETHLRDTPLLARVSAEGLREIAASTQLETYGKFEWNAQYRTVSQKEPSHRISAEPLIAAEGHYANALVMIRAGFARLSHRYGNGHRTLAYLGKGQTFGLEELAFNWNSGKEVPLLNSLRAVGYVDILRIPGHLVETHVLPTLSGRDIAKLIDHVNDGVDSGSPERQLELASKSDVESGMLEFLLDQRLMNGTQTMLINTDRCTRCDDCIRACAATHDHNPRFIRHGPQIGKYMIANACMHCVDPVCMIGCPTGAIGRDANSGNVVINDQTCIGCATCANTCPYSNIRMVEVRSETGDFIVDVETQLPIVKATKCDLCAENWGGPACQRACPHDALVRIDLSDSHAIEKWLKDNG